MITQNFENPTDNFIFEIQNGASMLMFFFKFHFVKKDEAILACIFFEVINHKNFRNNFEKFPNDWKKINSPSPFFFQVCKHKVTKSFYKNIYNYYCHKQKNDINSMQ